MNTQERDFYLDNPHAYPTEDFTVENTAMLALTWLIIIVAIALTLLYRFKLYAVILLAATLTLCSCSHGLYSQQRKTTRHAQERFLAGKPVIVTKPY